MSVLILFIYGLIGFFVYLPLIKTYFLQDEWAIFGGFLYWEKANLGYIDRLFIHEQDTHVIPLSNLFSYIQYKTFGLELWPYAVTSIVLHVATTFMVYLVARKLLKNGLVAFMSGLLFLISSVHMQAVAWIATTIGTTSAVLIFLTSLYIFLQYLENKKHPKALLFISFLLFVASLGFKESTVAFGLCFPLLAYMYKEKQSRPTLKPTLQYLFIIGSIYTLFRLGIKSVGYIGPATAAEISQPGVLVYFFRAVTFPIKAIAQAIIPQTLVIRIADIFVHVAYPQFVQEGTANPYIVQGVASDIVSYAIGLFVIVCGFFLIRTFRSQKNIALAHGVAICIAMGILGVLPLIVIPGPAGYVTLFDGRHLYAVGPFVSMLLAIIGLAVYKAMKKRTMLIGIFILLLLTIGYSHMKSIRSSLATQVFESTRRRQVIADITSLYPKLPRKTIVYTQSNKAYFGLPPQTYIMPFQSGFGEVLMVLYNQKDSLPACFFYKKFLYSLLEEGYKECEGRGFGYARTKEKLEELMTVYDIPASDIIALAFDASTNTVRDISQVTRESINK